MAKKYRSFSPEFKFRVVLEVLTGAKRPAEVCREHQIADSVLSRGLSTDNCRNCNNRQLEMDIDDN